MISEYQDGLDSPYQGVSCPDIFDWPSSLRAYTWQLKGLYILNMTMGNIAEQSFGF